MSAHAGHVFGIGLSRTGTRSLATALDVLGIPCVHYPDPALMLAGAYERAFEGKRAATDITVTAFYESLDAAYPGSKFVMTVRAIGPWLDSIRAHTHRIIRDAPHELDEDNPKGIVRRMCFGTMGWDEDRFVATHAEHRASVERYFAGDRDRLLVIDVTDGDAWSSLCGFLGVNEPSVPFPHVNRRVVQTSDPVAPGQWR